MTSSTGPYSHLANSPAVTGYMVIREDGAVVFSHGQLQNNERIAQVFHKMAYSVRDTHFLQDPLKRLNVHYDDYTYSMCLANKRLVVVKRRNIEPDD